MEFKILVFVFLLVLPMDIATGSYDRESEIARLTDKCMRFRYQDLPNHIYDINTADVISFCVLQAINTINRRMQKPDIAEDVILHNLDLYRNMLQRNSGSENLHSIKQHEKRTHNASGRNTFLTSENSLKPMMPTDQMKNLQATAAAPGTTVKTDKMKSHGMTHNHRVKRNTHNALDWAAIYDFFLRLRQSTLPRNTGPQFVTNNRLTGQRLVTNNRLTGPQRARAAVAAIGPLPIGRRFTSPFTDPRTRGDPLPIGPLRPRLRRGFYPIIQQRGSGSFKDYTRTFVDPDAGLKFKSILTDARTKGDPMVIAAYKPHENQIKYTGVNTLQIKHTTPQAK